MAKAPRLKDEVIEEVSKEVAPEVVEVAPEVVTIIVETTEAPVLLQEPVMHKMAPKEVIPEVITSEVSERVLLTSNSVPTKSVLQETEASIAAAKSRPSLGWWYGR
jgi:hypothetical protein